MQSKTETFVGLVKRYDLPLTDFSKSYVKKHEVAQEVVSDVFFALWEKKGIIDDIKNIESYLYMSAKNHCINYLNSKIGKKETQTEQTISFDFLIENYDPEKMLLNKEKAEVLDSAIEELPHSCKVVFNLVKQQGMKQKQVAEIMDISVKTVENHVARAVKKLRHALKKYNKDNGNGNIRLAAFIMVIALLQTIQGLIEPLK